MSSRFAHMALVHAKYGEGKEGAAPSPTDWKEAISEPFKNGDVQGMKQKALAANQYHMQYLAHSASSETVQFQANAFLLSQSGEGPVQKQEIRHNYEQMPADQLVAIIQSKLSQIQKLNPDFDIQKLLPPPSVSRETIIEVESFNKDEVE